MLLQKNKKMGEDGQTPFFVAAYANPKTLSTPYTIPTIPTNVRSPHIATSEVSHVLVFVDLTVEIKTFARMTTTIVREIMPIIKFAMIIHLEFCYLSSSSLYRILY
jgi:hypothetical protein